LIYSYNSSTSTLSSSDEDSYSKDSSDLSYSINSIDSDYPSYPTFYSDYSYPDSTTCESTFSLSSNEVNYNDDA